ncbi:MAG: UDP-N-acetylglucosamine 2-epimerase (hydrolyzing) [Candidatus Omnitrophica bacterium]|nr:UDP-N-acetylglucosamine 2-epimerase (hydrolyzing) [Candidatus Omnitrophota bacterium]MDE2223437.1 UDP-N-acetylglucosamine 2-epimerase (hydrolyzing) [Candidatus Omnitrophota bacterium]
MKKRICVFTGSRAEYGLLRPLISALKEDGAFEVRLLVSGMHTEKQYGLTHQEIIKDGIAIDAMVRIMTRDNSTNGVARAMGKGIVEFVRILSQWKPDLVVILGDRFETLAMAQSAMLARVAIAHIHGGEATYGAMDEAIRHAITKISHLHFTSTDEYRRRIIQLGEDPRRVFNVGALGIDNIHQLKLMSREEAQRQMGFCFKERNLLVTFHPVTLHPGQSRKQFQTLLNELDCLKNTQLIFTKSNADMEGVEINGLIDKYVRSHQDKAVAFASMGQVVYLSALKWIDAVVGNSSSGIIEAPSFKIGTINIGDRQDGRVRASSVIDCPATSAGIKRALRCLYSRGFQKKLPLVKNPYGREGAAQKIVAILRRQRPSGLLVKKFFNIKALSKG